MDAQALVDQASLKALDASFTGAYALFIYEPKVDSTLKVYLSGNALAADSGKQLFCLYEPAVKSRPSKVGSGTPGIGEVETASPLIDFLRDLFPGQHLELPGVVLVRRLAEPLDAVYVPLHDIKDAKLLTSHLRTLFSNAVGAVGTGRDPRLYASDLGRALALGGFRYVKSSPRSVGELLLIAARTLWDHRKDLAVLVRSGAKIAHNFGLT
jgi:hypothetical protein